MDTDRKCDLLTCSRLSSSARVPVSPLLLIGISMVAALLIILSAIVESLQDSKNTAWHHVFSLTK